MLRTYGRMGELWWDDAIVTDGRMGELWGDDASD
jgi:hypothetical protein